MLWAHQLLMLQSEELSVERWYLPWILSEFLQITDAEETDGGDGVESLTGWVSLYLCLEIRNIEPGAV